MWVFEIFPPLNKIIFTYKKNSSPLEGYSFEYKGKGRETWIFCILRCLAGFDAGGHCTTNMSCFVYLVSGPRIIKL